MFFHLPDQRRSGCTSAPDPVLSDYNLLSPARTASHHHQHMFGQQGGNNYEQTPTLELHTTGIITEDHDQSTAPVVPGHHYNLNNPWHCSGQLYQQQMDALQFDGSSADAFFGQHDHEQAYHLGGGRGQEQEVEQNYNAHQQYNDHMNMLSEKYVHDAGLGRRGPPLAPGIMRPQHQHHEPPLAAALGGGLRDDLHEGAGSSASGLSSCAGSAVVDQFNTENFQAAAGVELLIHRGGGDESATPAEKTLLESLMEREDSLTEGNADDSIDVMPPLPQQDELPGTGNNRRRVTPLKVACSTSTARIQTPGLAAPPSTATASTTSTPPAKSKTTGHAITETVTHSTEAELRGGAAGGGGDTSRTTTSAGAALAGNNKDESAIKAKKEMAIGDGVGVDDTMSEGEQGGLTGLTAWSTLCSFEDQLDSSPPAPTPTPAQAQKLCEIVHAHILKHHSVSKKARLRGLLLSKGPMKDALQEIFLGGGTAFGVFQTEEMQRQVLEAVLRGRPQWFKLHSENSGNQVSVEALEYPTKASACSMDATTPDDQQLKAKECTDHVLESKLQNNQLQINKEKETDTNKKAAAHQLENRVEELRLDLMNQNMMKSPPPADVDTSAHHVHFLNQLEKMLAKKSQGWLLVDEIERREEYQRWAEKNKKVNKKAGLVASTSTSASTSKSTSISKLSELASSAVIGNAKNRFVVRPRDPTKPGKLVVQLRRKWDEQKAEQDESKKKNSGVVTDVSSKTNKAGQDLLSAPALHLCQKAVAENVAGGSKKFISSTSAAAPATASAGVSALGWVSGAPAPAEGVEAVAMGVRREDERSHHKAEASDALNRSRSGRSFEQEDRFDFYEGGGGENEKMTIEMLLDREEKHLLREQTRLQHEFQAKMERLQRRLKDLRDEKQRFSRLKLGSAGASAKTRG